YVRLGLGIGVIARMAVEDRVDDDLTAVDAGHLFPNNSTKIGFRRGKFLRGYLFEFLSLFAPHLTLLAVDQAAHSKTRDDVDAIFADVPLQTY
ncbi:MAG: HTH-type transcriptional regulator CysB, partial [Pseudomonadota bacterium]